MRKFLRRFFCALLSLVLVAAVSTAIAVPAVIRSRGDLSDYMVSEEFQESIGKANAKRAKDTSARIMSANLLVHYESWGGTDAHKRAKMFLQVLDTYRPDVVAVQEMSDQWYCCLMQNRGSYKLLYPVRTGALVRMTGLLYDSDRVTLLEHCVGTVPKQSVRRKIYCIFHPSGPDPQRRGKGGAGGDGKPGRPGRGTCQIPGGTV